MKTIVIKLGGAVCLRPDTLDALATGLRTMLGAGYSPVLVHGGGPQLDEAIKTLGEPVVKHKGLRYTSEAAAAVVERELDGIGQEVSSALREKGLPAVHMGTALRLVKATVKQVPDGFDLGRVGHFRGIDARLIMQATATVSGAGVCIPVVTPVGFDEAGPLNVNADEAAAGIAAALKAERLFLATDVPHVRDLEGNAVRAIDEVAAVNLILDGAAQDGMIPKLMAALAALEGGVQGVLVTSPDLEALQAAVLPNPKVGTWIEQSASIRIAFHDDQIKVIPAEA